MGFLVGFVGPLAGVGGGVLFTPLALGLLGVDVNLARAGGLLVAASSVAGSLYLRRGLRILGLCGGGYVAGRVPGGASCAAEGVLRLATPIRMSVKAVRYAVARRLGIEIE